MYYRQTPGESFATSRNQDVCPRFLDYSLYRNVQQGRNEAFTVDTQSL